MGEDLKKHLVKEGIETVKKHPKISSTSYIPRELQIKTPVGNANLQKMATPMLLSEPREDAVASA